MEFSGRKLFDATRHDVMRCNIRKKIVKIMKKATHFYRHFMIFPQFSLYFDFTTLSYNLNDSSFISMGKVFFRVLFEWLLLVEFYVSRCTSNDEKLILFSVDLTIALVLFFSLVRACVCAFFAVVLLRGDLFMVLCVCFVGFGFRAMYWKVQSVYINIKEST